MEQDFNLLSSDNVASATSICGGPLERVVLGPGELAVIGTAALFPTEVVNSSANVAELVVGWVERSWDGGWSWGDAAGLDLDVADVELWPVAGALAAVMPQPGGVAAPVGDDEAHAVGDVVSHVVQVRAVSGHGLGLAILSEGGGEARELVVVGVELDLGVEGLQGVDGVAISGAVGRIFESRRSVLLALAALVAGVVEALVGGVVALVGSGGPGPLVGLHDVKLRAPVAVDLVSVAVAPFVCVHPKGAIFVLAWHGDQVESSDTAALVLAQVDVVLDVATEEVGAEIVRFAEVQASRLGNVSSAVGGDLVLGATSGSEGRSDVVGLGDTVNLHLDGGEAIFLLGGEV